MHGLISPVPVSAAAPPAFATPADVPARLDDAQLLAALASGRPAGEAGTLDVDGVLCPTVTAGAGRAVLCVHGLGHDSWDWAPLFVRCSKQARLTAIDLPGFGLSSRPERRWDVGILVEALLVAARRCPEPPMVVASSLGAHVALLAALREPQAFARLVLSAPGGVVEVPAPMQEMLRAYYSVDAIVQRKDEDIVGNSRRIFATPGLAVDDALAARKLAVHRSSLARAFAVPFAGVVDDVFRHLVLPRLPELRLPELRVPVVVVSGARDVVVPPEACARAARQMGARLISIDGVGHCPHLEAPDRFADIVKDALGVSSRDEQGWVTR